MGQARRFLPLVLFLGLLVFLGIGLTLNPREVPSPLVGKKAPAFALPRLDAPQQTFTDKDMLGKVWLLNVWASWCVSCREEHHVLLDIAKAGVIPVVGLNYKDEARDGIKWLRDMGDPYQLSVQDRDGRVGIDYGVYGVPETFLIDRHGVIRYKRIGVLTPEIVKDKILPLVKELMKDA